MTNHPNRSQRTKFIVEDNTVTVDGENPWTGEREVITYFVPWKGGYVRISDKQCRYPQVCVGLANRGPTLTATVETLPDVIRREYRRSKHIYKRELREALGY